MVSTRTSSDQFWLDNPEALAEYHRRLTESNNRQPEHRRVQVLGLDELKNLATT
jgi:hypothetical protein